jgi:DNA mismatch endonuclease (patch repair protein)
MAESHALTYSEREVDNPPLRRSPRTAGQRKRVTGGPKEKSPFGDAEPTGAGSPGQNPPGAEPASVPCPAIVPRYREREGHVLLVDDATSARMALVRQKGTRPELVVRTALTALGHRFRLGNRSLEGSPDIVNQSRRWVVFVHGCFWHRHGCKATTTPARNREFWEAKFLRNLERDRRTIEALRARGYTVVVIWECETKRTPELLRARLAAELGDPPRRG